MITIVKSFVLICDMCRLTKSQPYDNAFTATVEARKLGWVGTADNALHTCPDCTKLVPVSPPKVE